MNEHVDGPPSASPARPSDEALETSRLLLELIHAAYATREVDSSEGPPERGHAATGRPTVSAHAIRAAIHIYQHDDRTVGELAEGLGISYGWASRVVSELEASGLVARSVDPADRRVVHVTLTPAAVDVVERAYRWRGDAIERALDPLDAPGRLAVRSFLRRVVDGLSPAGRDRPADPT